MFSENTTNKKIIPGKGYTSKPVYNLDETPFLEYCAHWNFYFSRQKNQHQDLKLLRSTDTS